MTPVLMPLWQVSYEEKALSERYSNYKDYMAKVKKFIPYVY